MDLHKQTAIEQQLERTADALRSHRFDAQVIRSREELFRALEARIPKGACCATGGSVTLAETGVLDYLRTGDFHYDEQSDMRTRRLAAFDSDVYLMSSNAITEQGQLYNMDGRGNRVAALTFGPKKVIVIAGYNKIVPDVEAARVRNCKIAAPANARRLNMDGLPCYHKGCSNCNSPGRFCAAEVVTHCQMEPGRVTVLLLNESVGY